MKIFYFLLIFTWFFFVTKVTAQENEGIIQINSSDNIEQIIQKKINKLKNTTEKKVYRIQIFFGSENGANNSKNEFRELHPDTKVTLIFDSPYWKVHVGQYDTIMKAEKALEEISLTFEDALIPSKPVSVKI
jgi:tRNA U34 2-thiouridine synthase MnmA/TrmU